LGKFLLLESENQGRLFQGRWWSNQKEIIIIILKNLYMFIGCLPFSIWNLRPFNPFYKIKENFD
jgi:hypothetical protein